MIDYLHPVIHSCSLNFTHSKRSYYLSVVSICQSSFACCSFLLSSFSCSISPLFYSHKKHKQLIICINSLFSSPPPPFQCCAYFLSWNMSIIADSFDRIASSYQLLECIHSSIVVFHFLFVKTTWLKNYPHCLSLSFPNLYWMHCCFTRPFEISKLPLLEAILTNLSSIWNCLRDCFGKCNF